MCVDPTYDDDDGEEKSPPVFNLPSRAPPIDLEKINAWLQFSILNLAFLAFGLPHNLRIQPVHLLKDEVRRIFERSTCLEMRKSWV